MNAITRLTRRLLVAAAALVLAVAFGVSAEPAFAHDQLVEATPGDGDTVDVAPEAVKMVFSGAPQKLGNEIQVEHDGENVAVGDPETQFHTITQSLKSDLTPGDYTVDWRVVSEDGHPVDGTFTFTVQETEPHADVASPTPDTTDTSSDGTQASQAATSDDNSGPTAVLIAALALSLVVIAAFIVFVVIRRRRIRGHD